jgi:septal ring factor EnvC (AmiA/AmiB activator)
MLSILTQRLTGSLLLNPWVMLAVLGGLVASHSFVAYKAYSIGGATQQLVCEKRIDRLNEQIEKQQAEIAKANADWQQQIDFVTQAYNEAAQTRQDSIDKLEREITDYEKTLEELRKVPGANRGCKLDRRDLDGM